MSYAQSIDGLNIKVTTGKVAQSIGSLDMLLSTSEGAIQDGIVLLSPANGEINVSITPSFDWGSSTAYDAYKILIDADPEFSSPIEAYITASDYAQTEALLNATNYHWKVIGGTVTDRPAIVPGTISDNSTGGDIASLELIYQSLNGDSWTNNTGWNATGMSLDPAPYGVTVETISGQLRVTSVDLTMNNCAGQYPEDVPGLQELKDKFYFKQHVPEDESNQTIRITGLLPSWLGQTKVKKISLSGRSSRSGTWTPFDADQGDVAGYNMKHGKASNQYTGGIPPEWKNLNIEVLEIDAQEGQFDGKFEPFFANWTNMRRFWATNNTWKGYGQESGWSGYIDYCQTWVNCEAFEIYGGEFTGIALDLFSNWNNILERIVVISGPNKRDFFFNHPLPDISRLTNCRDFGCSNRKFNGDYPVELHNFSNSNQVGFDGNDFDLAHLGGQVPTLSNLDRARTFSIKNNNLDGRLFRDNEDTTGYFSNAIILWSCRINPNLRHTLPPRGSENWFNLRSIRTNNTFSQPHQTLPLEPPGKYAPSLIGLFLWSSGLMGSIPASYGKLGSKEPYGGVLYSGTMTNANRDERWIEDTNANWEIDEFKALPGKPGPRLRTDKRADRVRIISNTATRIYYDPDYPLSGTAGAGDWYEIVRNLNADERPLEQLNLHNNWLSGEIPAESAPEALMSGGLYTVALNKFTFKDILPSIQDIEAKATAGGWNYKYAPQKPFGEEYIDEVPEGSSFTLDFFEFDYSGNEYQWQLDGVNITDNANYSGTNTHTLVISDFSSLLEGVYTLIITNPSAPDLSGEDALTSEPQELILSTT